MNRERWLQQATTALRPVFEGNGHAIPDVSVSVGFPGGGSARKRIGECWAPEACSDHRPAVFVSPVLEETQAVLATLVHELVHAAVGTQCGHKGPFKALATSLGLEGKMTATHAGPELLALFAPLTRELGDYPHGAVNLSARKRQKTRLLKAACVTGCASGEQFKPYCVRITQLHVDAYGPPVCPGCNEVMELEG